MASEGIAPSNVERGYILRRILRRAISLGKMFDLPHNFLIPLAQTIIQIYNEVYPELKSQENNILATIQNEEEDFNKTLEKGIEKMELS